ncbi:unnamed protein product, partial [marine sediment metagenome]
GATPEKGENAILKMAALLVELDAGFREQLDAHTDPVLGSSTMNIGTCQGGTRDNIVPDSCRARIDMRLTPSLPPAQALALLEDFLRDRDVSAKVKSLLQTTPLATDPDNEFVQRLASLGAPLAGAPWFCDAAVLASAGIPGVAIGPGSIAQAHTKE